MATQTADIIAKLSELRARMEEGDIESDAPELELVDYLYKNPAVFCYLFLNIDLGPHQQLILRMFMDKQFPLLVASRGSGKTFLLGLYAIIRSIFWPGSEIALIGPTFRQSRFIFKKIEDIYDNAPLLREMCWDKPKHHADHSILKIGKSTITAYPLGVTGGKMRGARANVTIVDEFREIETETFDVVIRGFAAVAKDPAKRWRALQRGETVGDSVDPYSLPGNQLIIASSATFQFNHFYQRYKEYCQLIEDGLAGRRPDDRWKKYGVILLPYQAVPEGFMELDQIMDAKEHASRPYFQMEYEAKFPTDTEGFYPASLLERQQLGYSGRPRITTKGSAGKMYFMGIDPARTTDDCAVTILEAEKTQEEHATVVYAWAKQGRNWPSVVRHVRSLLRDFDTLAGIAIDVGGGGRTISDLLQEAKLIEDERDQFIWELPELNKDTAQNKGKQLLYLVDCTAKWNIDANHSLRGALDHRSLFFGSKPDETELDAVSLDKTEDVWAEIAKMTRQCVLIEISHTTTGIQRFDLPDELKKDTHGDNKKDLYSSLLLAWFVYHYWHEKEMGPGRRKNLVWGGPAIPRT